MFFENNGYFVEATRCFHSTLFNYLFFNCTIGTQNAKESNSSISKIFIRLILNSAILNNSNKCRKSILKLNIKL